ncbi:hypothetical protein Tco_0418832 [Tanacetum coccineum]
MDVVIPDSSRDVFRNSDACYHDPEKCEHAGPKVTTSHGVNTTTRMIWRFTVDDDLKENSKITQPTPTWTSPPPQYHPTATPVGSRGVLGPAPGQAHVVQPTSFGLSGLSSHTNGPLPGTWGPQVVYGSYVDQATTLSQAFNTMTLQDHGDSGWYMDTGATSHLASDTSKLTSVSNKSIISSILVGNGNSIPVTNTGHSMFPTLNRPLHLHNVLVTPNIIKNLIYVRQFTRDNSCSIEFDPFGFIVKDLWTRHLLL